VTKKFRFQCSPKFLSSTFLTITDWFSLSYPSCRHNSSLLFLVP